MADQPPTDTARDVITRLAVVDMHQPYGDAKGAARCASATRALSRLGPRWPCARWREAQRAIEARERAQASQTNIEPAVTS